MTPFLMGPKQNRRAHAIDAIPQAELAFQNRILRNYLCALSLSAGQQASQGKSVIFNRKSGVQYSEIPHALGGDGWYTAQILSQARGTWHKLTEFAEGSDGPGLLPECSAPSLPASFPL